MPRPPSSATLAELKASAGAGNYLESAQDVGPYLSDFRRLYHGATPLVLRPRSVEEVSRLLQICNRDEVAVVIVHAMTQTGVVEAGVSRRISAWKPERGAAASASFVAHEFSDRPSVGQRR